MEHKSSNYSIFYELEKRPDGDLNIRILNPHGHTYHGFLKDASRKRSLKIVKPWKSLAMVTVRLHTTVTLKGQKRNDYERIKKHNKFPYFIQTIDFHLC